MQENETTRPTHIEVSDSFYNDSCDLTERFEYCWHAEFPSFDAIKSKRFKLFIDLRIALESTLKAIVAYKKHSSLSGETLVKKIRSYSHNIEKLKNASLEFIPNENRDWLQYIAEQCNSLPVSLRYKLDAFDFKYAEDKLYYETIGSDRWMDTFLNNVKTINNYIGTELSKESRILTGEDLRAIVFQPEYNSYLANKKK